MKDFIDWFFKYSSLVKYYKYLCYVIKHKFYVGFFLWKKHYYWQALTHDISKLRWFPFKTYANYFYGEKGVQGNSESGYSKPVVTSDKDFDYAWLLHQKINPHHWQFWILMEDSGNVKLLDIPGKYIVEMVCDWYGASIASGRSNWSNYKTNTKKWYLAHRDIIQISNNTRRLLEWELEVWTDNIDDFEKETERKMSTNF